ncbi:sodium-coupled monocarboxylate transporter 1-like [Dreissena polymorpha]|nr:sodium-coupled monocarboxylate transporter 1-like [Dreissena polymorpha]
MSDPVNSFHVLDYVAMGLFFLVCTGIGVYYGCYKKQKTTEEYLLGGRRMHLIPVAISLLVTYQSAISVLGVPLETYVYNTMSYYMVVAIMIAHAIQGFFIVPLVYPLGISSSYEYFGRRFKSRAVQLLGTAMGMLQTLMYMAIVLLAPALALEAVAGIPLWVSIVVVGIIGAAYTSIGGMKTVIWTDVFQFIILYGGLIVILVLALIEVGGFYKVFGVAIDGKRIVFDEINPDPRVRHTIWGLLCGGVFNWLPNCCNQSAVQRISSMKSARDAKISCLLNVPLQFVYSLILTLVGLVIYAYFVEKQCDPYLSGAISNYNQLMPYFVMKVFHNVPGLAGLFIAALFSGSLSTLSSGINSMSANTLKDILPNVLRNAQQYNQTVIAKVASMLFGAMAVGLAYLAKSLSGPVTQIAITTFGAVGGPMAGIFFLGAVFPQANWIGAFSGGMIGLAINMWVAIGSVMYGAKAVPSPRVSIEDCSVLNFTGILSNLTSTSTPTFANTTWLYTTQMSKHIDGSQLAIYDVSYVYFGLIGTIITIVSGILISICTGSARGDLTCDEYIFPCLRRVWKGHLISSQPGKYKAYKNKTSVINEHEINVAPIKALE